MGIRINLLPKSYQPPKPLGAKEMMIAAAVGLVLFGGGAYYVSAWTGLGKMEQQITTKGSQLQQVQLKLADASAVKQREQKVSAAEGDLKALMGRDWSPLLESLAEMTPQNLTWTELKAGEERVSLKGNARGLMDLAQLFGGVVNHPAVEYAGLRYVNEQGVTITLTIKEKDGTVNMAGLTGGAPSAGTAGGPGAAGAPGAATATGVPGGGTAGGQPGGPGAPQILGEYHRMEFEVFIELKPLKGGEKGGA